jgi:hypothetical protein
VRDGTMRREKIPIADGRWVGLVLLFSTQTGEPLAIMPDGVLQRTRVGATNGLGAKYLARHMRPERKGWDFGCLDVREGEERGAAQPVRRPCQGITEADIKGKFLEPPARKV